jgi:hypothetical protein
MENTYWARITFPWVGNRARRLERRGMPGRPHRQGRDWGLARWAPHLLDLLFDSSNRTVRPGLGVDVEVILTPPCIFCMENRS